MTDALTQAINPPVELTVNGKTYTLALDLPAVLSLHKTIGLNIFAVKQWARIAEDPSVLIATLWAALQVHHAAEFKTVKEAEKLVNMDTFVDIDKALGNLLISYLPKPEKASPNAQAASQS